jgi:hypothetical protein
MKTSTATWSRPRATPRWRGCIVDVTERIRIIRRVDFTKQARIDSTYEEHGKILKAVQRKRGDQAAICCARAYRDQPGGGAQGQLASGPSCAAAGQQIGRLIPRRRGVDARWQRFTMTAGPTNRTETTDERHGPDHC